jgi:hypothetical protein
MTPLRRKWGLFHFDKEQRRKRFRNKYVLLLFVSGILVIASVFRLERLPAFLLPQEASRPTSVSQVSSTSPPEYRYKDDIIRGDDIQKAVARDIARFRRECADKKWALEILHSSDGIFEMDGKTCRRLPTQSEVSHLYGADPVVYGMETCEQFRRNVQQAQKEAIDSVHALPTVRVAGLFNTGTNAMAASLARNLQQNYPLGDEETLNFTKIDELLRVPWDKHVPPRFRGINVLDRDQGIDLRLVLPVVMVRDPYGWMQSMVGRIVYAWCMFGCNIMKTTQQNSL